MKHYELVLILDAATSMDTIKKIREEIEPIIPHLLDTDDMGMLPLATKLNGHTNAYFLSYYFQSDTKDIEAIKQYIRITRAIVKSSIFSMLHDEKFLKYADLKRSYEILAERDIPKKVVRNAQKQVEILEVVDALEAGVVSPDFLEEAIVA